MILGGMLVYRMDEAREVLRFSREFMVSAPDEVSLWNFLMTIPPDESYPAELHGQRVVASCIAYAGSLEEGEKVIAPLRASRTPAVDMLGPISYVELQSMFDPSVLRGMRYYDASHYLNGYTDEAIDVILEQFEGVGSDLSYVIMGDMGGAFARVPADATAFGDRTGPSILWIVAEWEEGDGEEHREWTRAIMEATQPFSTGTAYVNAMSVDHIGGVRAGYGEKFEKLQALKDKYDPENILRLNQNIPPTGWSAPDAATPASG